MSIGDLLYAFINTAGVGGVFVLIVYTSALITYFLLTRWILQGGKSKD